MDLTWLSRNIKTSWRHRDTLLDFMKRLVWIYSNNLPPTIKKAEWVIGFNYPEPVGNVRLLLRSNFGSDSFIHGEVFELQYYDLALSFAPMTILDLGANIGLTSVYFAKRFPHAQIAAVEPVPTNLGLLRKNLELNGVVASVIAGAIDTADGRVFMDIEQKDYGCRVLDPNEAQWQRGIEVAAYSVPTLLRDLGWDRIGLLKVDIEGHERKLLARCESWMHLVDAMCIECHEGFGRAELRDFARRSGFRPPEQLPGIWLLKR
jgi:FkbM family methyltransferase